MTKAEIYFEVIKALKTCNEHSETYTILNNLVKHMRSDVKQSQKNPNASDCVSVLKSILLGNTLYYNYCESADGNIILITPHILVKCKTILPEEVILLLNKNSAPYVDVDRIINRDYSEPDIICTSTDSLNEILTEIKLSKRKGRNIVRKFKCGLCLNAELYRYAMVLTEADCLYAPKRNGKFCEPVAFLGEDYDVYAMPMSGYSLANREAGFIVY